VITRAPFINCHVACIPVAVALQQKRWIVRRSY
jgi:hypothetical protein